MGHDPSYSALETMYCDLLQIALKSNNPGLTAFIVRQLGALSFTPAADLDPEAAAKIAEILFQHCALDLQEQQRREEFAPFVLTHNSNRVLERLASFEFPKHLTMDIVAFDIAQRKNEDGYVALKLLAQKPERTRVKLSNKQQDTARLSLARIITLCLDCRELMWQKWRKECFEDSLSVLYELTKTSSIPHPEVFVQLEEAVELAAAYSTLPRLLEVMRNCSEPDFGQFLDKQLKIVEVSDNQQDVYLALCCYTEFRQLPKELISSVTSRFQTPENRLATILMKAH